MSLRVPCEARKKTNVCRLLRCTAKKNWAEKQRNSWIGTRNLELTLPGNSKAGGVPVSADTGSAHVCLRERERERERLCVCEREREREEKICVSMACEMLSHLSPNYQ